MQISRHWRMNSLRYRLQGIRYTNGDVRLQPRPLNATETAEVEPARVEVARAESKIERAPAATR